MDSGQAEAALMQPTIAVQACLVQAADTAPWHAGLGKVSPLD